MNYIYYTKNGKPGVVKPEMDKPECFRNDESDWDCPECKSYELHIRTLPFYEFPSDQIPASFKEGEEVKGNVRLQHQKWTSHFTNDHWDNCSEETYMDYPTTSRRIIPIIEHLPDVRKTIEENTLELYMGDFQSYVDRILRDKGASNKDVYDAINETICELNKTYQILKR